VSPSEESHENPGTAAPSSRMGEQAEPIRGRESRTRDEFAFRVSHLLRTPLTSMYALTAEIADESAGKINSEQSEYLRIVLRNVLQLKGMIGDLLELHQLQAGKVNLELQALRVEGLVAEAVAKFKRVAGEKGIAVSFECDSGIPQGHADAQRVLRVLEIVLDNAVKFTQPGGKVHVQVGVHAEKENYLLIHVSDTGCGIEPEAAARIFEQLYRVPDSAESAPGVVRRGLGLGLYLGKEWIHRLGGDIWVTSELNKGSRFSFTLPTFQPRPSKETAANEEVKDEAPQPPQFTQWRRRLQPTPSDTAFYGVEVPERA
jgi:signal transduction histidine kinase